MSKSKKQAPSDLDKSFVEIDELQLDKEWIGQPRVYLEFAEMCADAQRDWDIAKSELEMVRAELDTAIRSDPESYGLGKVTEKGVENAIPAQTEYQDAVREVIRAKHKRDVMAAAVTALDHRKKALEKLVDLQLSGYFATPRASASSREAVEDMGRRNVRRPLQKKTKKED